MDTQTAQPPDSQAATSDPQATFYSDALGVRAARQWVAAHLEGRRRAGDMETVASELLTNAVRHTADAGNLFTVITEYDETGGIGIVVRDGGSTRSAPHVQHPTADDEHGHGMVLVSGLADSWGTSVDPTGRRDTWAWFDDEEVRRHVGR